MTPSPAGEPLLVLRAVAKSYRAGAAGCMASVRVLDAIDLVVRAGERVAIVGAAGSGKTTLLLLAAGLLRPDTGAVWRAESAVWTDTAPPVLLGQRAAGVRERWGAAVGRADNGLGERLAWLSPRARGATLAVMREPRRTFGASRVLRLDRGRLLTGDDVPGLSRVARVDSAPGAL